MIQIFLSTCWQQGMIATPTVFRPRRPVFASSRLCDLCSLENHANLTVLAAQSGLSPRRRLVSSNCLSCADKTKRIRRIKVASFLVRGGNLEAGKEGSRVRGVKFRMPPNQPVCKSITRSPAPECDLPRRGRSPQPTRQARAPPETAGSCSVLGGLDGSKVLKPLTLVP